MDSISWSKRYKVGAWSPVTLTCDEVTRGVGSALRAGGVNSAGSDSDSTSFGGVDVFAISVSVVVCSGTKIGAGLASLFDSSLEFVCSGSLLSTTVLATTVTVDCTAPLCAATLVPFSDASTEKLPVANESRRRAKAKSGAGLRIGDVGTIGDRSHAICMIERTVANVGDPKMGHLGAVIGIAVDFDGFR